MKLKEFKENLEKFIEEHPEALEFEVITSADDEGNYFNSVYYEPTIGYFDDSYGEFSSETDEEYNSVCLN